MKNNQQPKNIFAVLHESDSDDESANISPNKTKQPKQKAAKEMKQNNEQSIFTKPGKAKKNQAKSKKQEAANTKKNAKNATPAKEDVTTNLSETNEEKTQEEIVKTDCVHLTMDLEPISENYVEPTPLKALRKASEPKMSSNFSLSYKNSVC